jgi:hypothetical protein
MRDAALFLAFSALVWAAAVVGFTSLSLYLGDREFGVMLQTIQATSPNGGEYDASGATDE